VICKVIVDEHSNGRNENRHVAVRITALRGCAGHAHNSLITGAFGVASACRLGRGW
jgi:hypothetical protein